MADDEDDDQAGPQRSSRSNSSGADGSTSTAPWTGPAYLMWENSLEKLKILGYESTFCAEFNRKPFSRVHFVIPAQTQAQSHQYNEFIDICSWLFKEIKNDDKIFKRDEYDDPNTVANKLMLALRNLEFKLSFQSQKLKTANGEAVCSVIEFLVDKALEVKKFKWGKPDYSKVSNVEEEDNPEDPDIEDIEEEPDIAIEEDTLFAEAVRNEIAEISIDGSAHQILHAQVDPVKWKTELERVGPRLRTQQQLTMNEWRAHVDQTASSKGHIAKVLGETQGDLQMMHKEVADELNKMRVKEKYINHHFTNLCIEYKEVKVKLEELEAISSKTNERIAKLTNELAEKTEALEELKESFESRDSGMHDTSPLVRIKDALQHIKSEIYAFDLRIGVVSHALLVAKVNSTVRHRQGAARHARKRNAKNKKNSRANASYDEDDSGLSADDNR